MEDLYRSEAASSKSSVSSSWSSGHDLRGNSGNLGRTGKIRWKSGKRLDPRLLTLLKFFRELFHQRREFFHQIFPDLQHEFTELFTKIDGPCRTRLEDVSLSRAYRGA
ncbi:hypothetical protein NMG60_11020258 [Bertholletia excelsa]